MHRPKNLPLSDFGIKQKDTDMHKFLRRIWLDIAIKQNAKLDRKLV